MKTDNDTYRISFFNPTTEHARIDRNLAILLVSFWAIAVFGFQIALKVLEKPTPEKTLVVFESVWDDVRDGNAGLEQNQKFINSCLLVIGKSSVNADHLKVLKNAFGTTVFNMVSDDQKAGLFGAVNELNQFIANNVSLDDAVYIQHKKLIADMVAPLAGIDKDALLYELVHVGLTGNNQELELDTKAQLPQIMKLYLTHNQSVLTDFTLLGFPFHYFYTAFLLLVFFVGICWFYCVRVDRINARLGFSEK